MAIKYNKTKKKYINIVYAVLTVMLVCIILLAMMLDVYRTAEQEGYESLHVSTKQFKEDLILQINSDMENLSTMAQLASALYTKGENIEMIVNSFKPIGLLKTVGIMTPDANFITQQGSVYVGDVLNFETERAKGQNVSGRVISVTYPGTEVVRSAVPIYVNSECIGIMYGIMTLEDLKNRYADMARALDAQLYVYEHASGDFIIDTFHDKLGNISELKSLEWGEGYSYDLLISGGNGFASFRSATLDEILYVHYASLGISDWQIMLARPEKYVFQNVNNVSTRLVRGFGIMLLAMFVYVLFLFRTERRRALVTEQSSKIRKLLLSINQHDDDINEALERIVYFSDSESDFYVDIDGEDYSFVVPTMTERILKNDDRKYFLSQILSYAAEINSIKNASVSIMAVRANKHLRNTNIEFYDFLRKNKISEVSFASIADSSNSISVLGVVNPKRKVAVRKLLADIAVCFSIAIYNKKHLHRTEVAATTDALTGVSNRVTYRNDLMRFDKERPENFACVFVDVNGLHIYNNRYGHAAGDEMLLYIANTLKEVFYGDNIYRMGGDEFLVFCENADKDKVKENMRIVTERIAPMQYHVAVGMSFRTLNTDTEELVREAEKRMYEAKAIYYQKKEVQDVTIDNDASYATITTGIEEIDGLLSVMQEHYNGIYRVSLNTDEVRRILMPSYLGYNETEYQFKQLYTKYVNDAVSPDFHRALISFLNYDAIKRQLAEGVVPRITYKKTDGETVTLSVYNLDKGNDVPDKTLWVFAKT